MTDRISDITTEDQISTTHEDEAEATRCQLDRGLFALLYHELVKSRLTSTARKLLKEAGVEAVEFTGGVPPRLKDLVDTWNEKHENINTARKHTVASTISLVGGATERKNSQSSTTLQKPIDLTTARPSSASVSTIASGATPSPAVNLSHQDNKPKRKKRGIEPGKPTRGPWQAEEERRLKDAIQLYGDEDLELIEASVQTRSLKGIAKHLMKSKKGWGLENNRKIFDVLICSDPLPTMERLMQVKPQDRTERDLVVWLEWFIIHNNNYHPGEEEVRKRRLERQARAESVAAAAEGDSAIGSSTSVLSTKAMPPPPYTQFMSREMIKATTAANVATAAAAAQAVMESSKAPRKNAAQRAAAEDKSARAMQEKGSRASQRAESRAVQRKDEQVLASLSKRPRLASTSWTQMEEELLKRCYIKYKGNLKKIIQDMSSKSFRGPQDIADRIAELQDLGILTQPTDISKRTSSTVSSISNVTANLSPSNSLPQSAVGGLSKQAPEERDRKRLGRWTLGEIDAFNKVLAKTPDDFEALCATVPARSREGVALRLKNLAEGKISGGFGGYGVDLKTKKKPSAIPIPIVHSTTATESSRPTPITATTTTASPSSLSSSDDEDSY